MFAEGGGGGTLYGYDDNDADSDDGISERESVRDSDWVRFIYNTGIIRGCNFRNLV